MSVCSLHLMCVGGLQATSIIVILYSGRGSCSVITVADYAASYLDEIPQDQYERNKTNITLEPLPRNDPTHQPTPIYESY